MVTVVVLSVDRVRNEGKTGQQPTSPKESGSRCRDQTNDVGTWLSQNFHPIIIKCPPTQTPTRQTHTTSPSSSASSSSPSFPASSVQSSPPPSHYSATVARYFLGQHLPHHRHNLHHKPQPCLGRKSNSPCLPRAEAVISSPIKSWRRCQRSKITKSVSCSCLFSTPVAPCL